VLDAFGEDAHSIPHHEDPWRDGRTLAGIGQDAAIGMQQRLHGIPIDGDDPEVGRPGAKLVSDQLGRREPDFFGIFEAPRPTARIRPQATKVYRPAVFTCRAKPA